MTARRQENRQALQVRNDIRLVDASFVQPNCPTVGALNAESLEPLKIIKYTKNKNI